MRHELFPSCANLICNYRTVPYRTAELSRNTDVGTKVGKLVCHGPTTAPPSTLHVDAHAVLAQPFCYSNCKCRDLLQIFLSPSFTANPPLSPSRASPQRSRAREDRQQKQSAAQHRRLDWAGDPRSLHRRASLQPAGGTRDTLANTTGRMDGSTNKLTASQPPLLCMGAYGRFVMLVCFFFFFHGLLETIRSDGIDWPLRTLRQLETQACVSVASHRACWLPCSFASLHLLHARSLALAPLTSK
jgi:hypothetical protein